MKVNISLGGTFLVDPENRQFLRPSVEIIELDSEKDVDEQLKEAEEIIKKGWDKLLEVMIAKIKESILDRVNE